MRFSSAITADDVIICDRRHAHRGTAKHQSYTCPRTRRNQEKDVYPATATPAMTESQLAYTRRAAIINAVAFAVNFAVVGLSNFGTWGKTNKVRLVIVADCNHIGLCLVQRTYHFFRHVARSQQ
jgi:hypothetical protein